MIVLFVVNSHFLVAMGDFDSLQDSNTTRVNRAKCAPLKPDIYVRFWTVFHILDGLIYCIIPFLIMITCNFCVICKIVRSRIRSKQVVICRKKNTILKNSNTMLATEKRLSLMLVCVSLSFLVFTLPVFIIENLDSSYSGKKLTISSFLT